MWLFPDDASGTGSLNQSVAAWDSIIIFTMMMMMWRVMSNYKATKLYCCIGVNGPCTPVAEVSKVCTRGHNYIVSLDKRLGWVAKAIDLFIVSLTYGYLEFRHLLINALILIIYMLNNIVIIIVRLLKLITLIIVMVIYTERKILQSVILFSGSLALNAITSKDLYITWYLLSIICLLFSTLSTAGGSQFVRGPQHRAQPHKTCTGQIIKPKLSKKQKNSCPN